MLNVWGGGTLHQDTKDLSQTPLNENQHTHETTFHEGSFLNETTGLRHTYTNSFHHQAIKDLSNLFNATAHSSDGFIEAMESRQKHKSGMPLVIWLQWNPEYLVTIGDSILLKVWVENCSS